jgi:hypothetical protein
MKRNIIGVTYGDLPDDIVFNVDFNIKKINPNNPVVEVSSMQPNESNTNEVPDVIKRAYNLPTTRPSDVESDQPLPDVEEASPELPVEEYGELPTEEPSSGKHPGTSKTIWTNVVAIVAIVIQQKLGFVVDPEIQLEVIAALNIWWRMKTSQPLNMPKRKPKNV